MGFPRRVYLRPGEPEVTGPIRELVPLPFRRWGHQLHVARRSSRFLDLMVCRPTRLNGAEGVQRSVRVRTRGSMNRGCGPLCVVVARGHRCTQCANGAAIPLHATSGHCASVAGNSRNHSFARNTGKTGCCKGSTPCTAGRTCLLHQFASVASNTGIAVCRA